MNFRALHEVEQLGTNLRAEDEIFIGNVRSQYAPKPALRKGSFSGTDAFLAVATGNSANNAHVHQIERRSSQAWIFSVI